jgi:flagellar biosynthetic protein FliP
MKNICLSAGMMLLLSMLSTHVLAEPGIPALTLTDNPDGSKDYTMTLQVVAIMTSLSLLPAFVMMMTSFTRIIIVLSI